MSNVTPEAELTAHPLPAPVTAEAAVPRQRRSPSLQAIIAFKVLKGAILLSLAWGVYALADDDLSAHYTRVLHWARVDPEGEFFSNIADSVALVTPAKVRWFATGTMLYSLFSLVEGAGLMLRLRWAGWLAIGESAFFVPIELYELLRVFRWPLLVILLINVYIVVYLFMNRRRLFAHHH